MKLKEKIKRFLTLDVHGHEGFTLVELIIVIAILAILSSVAVVGYSSYIKKANMQADKTMIAEIANALTLAYYSNIDGENNGYIILSVNDDAKSGSAFVTNAMRAAYGENWDTVLKLKYADWSSNSNMLSKALAAGAVNSSSYITNSSVSELLGNVQEVTSAAAGLLGSVSRSENQYLTLLQTTMGEAYMEQAVASGVIGKDKETGEYYLLDGTYTEDKENNTITVNTDLQNQLSNLMVFGVADEMSGATEEEMMNMMTSGMGSEVDNTKYSTATVLAAQYALYKAYAVDCGAEKDFEELNAAITNASGTDDAQNALDTFMSKHEAGLTAYITKEQGDDVVFSDILTGNANAVTQIMNGVTSVSPDYATADTLTNSTLFTSSGVANDLNLFIGMAAIGETLSAEQLSELETLLHNNPNAVVILIANGNVFTTIE